MLSRSIPFAANFSISLSKNSKLVGRYKEMSDIINENKFNDCKDNRNKKEVPDPIVKDLISDKIRKWE